MKDLPLSFYEFLAILVPGFLLTMFTVISHGQFPNLNLDNTMHSLFLLAAAYIVGQIVGQTSLWTIERWTKWFLGEPALVLLGRYKGNCITRFFFPGYFESLHEESIKIYKSYLGAKDDDEMLKLTYTTIFTEARLESGQGERLNHWSRLLGFSRNICLVALLIAAHQIYNFCVDGINNDLYAGLAGLFVTLIMYYRYVRFFRTFNVDLIQWYVRRGKPL